MEESLKPGSEACPPRWATRVLRWYCKPALLEDLEGDLNEYFQRNLKSKSARRARLNYVLDVVKFFRLYTVRKPEFINLLIHWIMLGSYIKTSGRTLVRNKLFSFINIVGLAISMSVGLLLIAMLTDLWSYDNFHEHKDRIYRLQTTYNYLDEPPSKLASTSVKAGKLIAEQVPGIEKLVLMRNGFGGDASVGDKVIPIGGLYADSSFFDIFTFPLMSGDAATALAAPRSIVLTETTAKKLFGAQDALGKTISMDTVDYTVTGVMEDLPKLSHMRFESLVSFSTIEELTTSSDEFMRWTSVWSNYVYMLLPEDADLQNIQSNMNALAEKENAALEHTKIDLALQPINTIVLGPDLSNEIGPTMVTGIVWVLGGLTVIVILSACFNYTNLSIARALRRSREVGVRKVIGALRIHVLWQFLAESILVAALALVFSFGLFLVLRPQFLSIAPQLADLMSLSLSPQMLLYFTALALVVGAVAGIMPAIFFSRINAAQVLKDVSKMKVFRHLSMRRVLIVVQYTFSLAFIMITLIGYRQYKNFISFDLGFSTENIVNIRMAGNKPDALAHELSAIAEVTDMSRSLMVTNLGNYYGVTMKYQNPQDSATLWFNNIDERYIPLHGHQLLAGRNLNALVPGATESEILVNEQVLKRFDIGKRDPEKAVGEELTVDGRKLTIVGVLKDFHYGKVDSEISPVGFRYGNDERNGFLNVKIKTDDWTATFAKVEQAWRRIDKVHPLEARFYDDQIEESYSEFSALLKMIGFLSFLAISISSMGLFGMVVFTTETRLREISIRKVLGASESNLVLLLSRGFLILLSIAIGIALPATYVFIDQVILVNFPYHEPIGLNELFLSIGIVSAIAFLMIGTQTLRVARSSPSETLKSE